MAFHTHKYEDEYIGTAYLPALHLFFGEFGLNGNLTGDWGQSFYCTDHDRKKPSQVSGETRWSYIPPTDEDITNIKEYDPSDSIKSIKQKAFAYIKLYQISPNNQIINLTNNIKITGSIISNALQWN